MIVCCHTNTETITAIRTDEMFQCRMTNVVRNLTNGWRKRNEIVYATTGNKKENGLYPVNPGQFPKGEWLITGVFEIDEANYRSIAEYEEAIKTFGKYVITTNAYRDTPIWKVVDGLYVEPTDKLIRDSQFWIHGSDYKTSWGCIIVPDAVEQAKLANLCTKGLLEDSDVHLEVV